MFILRILGAIDLLAAFTLLLLAFGFEVSPIFLLLPATLLLIKGMFVFSGDVLSFVDLYSAIILFVSVFLTPFPILVWIATLLLLAKGLVSFM